MLIEIVVERCKLLFHTLLRVNFPLTSLEPIGTPTKQRERLCILKAFVLASRFSLPNGRP